MTSRPIAQTRIAGLALTLAGGSLLLAPSPAQAGVLDTPTTEGEVNFLASASCQESGPGDAVVSYPFAADGAPVTTSVSSSQTVTKTGNPADFTTMSGSTTQTIAVTQAANALKTIDVTASSQASLVSNLGSSQTCNASFWAMAYNTATFDLPSPKYVTVDVHSKGIIGALYILSMPSTYDDTVTQVQYGVHNRTTHTFHLPAGTYQLKNDHGLSMDAPTPTSPQPTSRSGAASFHISFNEPGVATTATTGDGAKYVDLAAGRSCAAGSLTGTWKSKAGKGKSAKVKKATFYVNGVKVGTERKPNKNTTKTLTGLNPDDPAVVLVTMKLAKHGAGTVSLQRSYLPCT